MIRIDDIIAARVLFHQNPELRAPLSECLHEVDTAEAESGFHTLLGHLLKRNTITRAQAEYVYKLVEQAKRNRALGFYAHLLVTEGGLERSAIQAHTEALGEQASSAGLGKRLIEEEQLDAETEARLRFRAKQAFDLDQAHQLERYHKRHEAETAKTLVGLGKNPSDTEAHLAESDAPRSVFQLDLDMPSVSEATGLFDRAALNLPPSIEQVAPRFAIPEWVDTNDPKVGHPVGDYRILGRIGAGSMGVVYLADTGEREQPIALKVLSRKASPERKARFKREILANGFFSHEQVIDIYDAGVTDDGISYLAMEFFDGGDLERIIVSEGSISVRQTLIISKQILAALQAAHEAGIVHRDVKPSNILVSPGGFEAKLMDFGIALIKDLGDFKDKVFESDPGGITGTPEYLSPEQAFRDPIGPQSDLYSYGVVMYRMLSGRLPYEAKTVPGWVSAHMSDDPLPIQQAAPNASLPNQLSELIERMLVKDPRVRIQTAKECFEIVEDVQLNLGKGRKSRLFSRFRRGF